MRTVRHRNSTPGEFELPIPSSAIKARPADLTLSITITLASRPTAPGWQRHRSSLGVDQHICRTFVSPRTPSIPRATRRRTAAFSSRCLLNTPSLLRNHLACDTCGPLRPAAPSSPTLAATRSTHSSLSPSSPAYHLVLPPCIPTFVLPPKQISWGCVCHRTTKIRRGVRPSTESSRKTLSGCGENAKSYYSVCRRSDIVDELHLTRMINRLGREWQVDNSEADEDHPSKWLHDR